MPAQVVERATLDPKLKGLNPAAVGIGRGITALPFPTHRQIFLENLIDFIFEKIPISN